LPALDPQQHPRVVLVDGEQHFSCNISKGGVRIASGDTGNRFANRPIGQMRSKTVNCPFPDYWGAMLEKRNESAADQRVVGGAAKRLSRVCQVSWNQLAASNESGELWRIEANQVFEQREAVVSVLAEESREAVLK
jgi:hypothetical protein